MKNFVFIFCVAHFRNYVLTKKKSISFWRYWGAEGFVLHPIFDVHPQLNMINEVTRVTRHTCSIF